VDPRTFLEAVAKRKISLPCRESNPGRPARSLVTILIELPLGEVTGPSGVSIVKRPT
jgi:hypothetical protein